MALKLSVALGLEWVKPLATHTRTRIHTHKRPSPRVHWGPSEAGQKTTGRYAVTESCHWAVRVSLWNLSPLFLRGVLRQSEGEMQERGGMMGRRGKESHRQRSSELLLIVNEIKGLKGLRQIEVGAAGAAGGGRGLCHSSAFSSCNWTRSARHSRNERYSRWGSVFFCVHVWFWMCNNSLNDDDMVTMMCSTWFMYWPI